MTHVYDKYQENYIHCSSGVLRGAGVAVAPGRRTQGGAETGCKKQGGAETGWQKNVFNVCRRAPIVCLSPGADYPQYATAL